MARQNNQGDFAGKLIGNKLQASVLADKSSVVSTRNGQDSNHNQLDLNGQLEAKQKTVVCKQQTTA